MDNPFVFQNCPVTENLKSASYFHLNTYIQARDKSENHKSR